MKTLKQQFNSAASGAIVHLRGRERALEGFGWAGRQAEWIALACLHGGVFTRAQWTSFLGCHHEKVRRAVHALVAQGAAIEENPPGIAGIGRVCRIHRRGIYRALGAGDRRRRRITSKEVLMRRLLAFDYVLDHPDLPWLPTEPEKMAAFEALSVERRLLPRRVYRGAAGNLRRYFPLRLPVALDAERAVFVYVDPGHETAMALRSWGAAHRELWEALSDRGRGIEVVVVVRTTDERGRAETVLANWARDPHPSEFDHEIGREIDRIDRAIIVDPKVGRELGAGEHAAVEAGQGDPLGLAPRPPERLERRFPPPAVEGLWPQPLNSSRARATPVTGSPIWFSNRKRPGCRLGVERGFLKQLSRRLGPLLKEALGLTLQVVPLWGRSGHSIRVFMKECLETWVGDSLELSEVGVLIEILPFGFLAPVRTCVQGNAPL